MEQAEKIVSELNFEAMLADRYMTPGERLMASVFFVEATSNEYAHLWEEHGKKGVDWLSISEGGLTTIGYIGKPKRRRSVCIAMRFAKIYGQYVCFYEATSRFVDWSMIEGWFRKKLGAKVAQMQNVNNFGIVLHGCKDLLEQQQAEKVKAN